MTIVLQLLKYHNTQNTQNTNWSPIINRLMREEMKLFSKDK